MNSFLLNRQLGSISPQAFATAQNNRLLRSLQAAPDVTFTLANPHGRDPTTTTTIRDDRGNGSSRGNRNETRFQPHPAGINSLAIDRFEGRYLLTAGADSSIAIWDLEEAAAPSNSNSNGNGTALTHTPLAHAPRTSTGTVSSLGLTQISYYPFDSLAFLTTGYDHTLQLFSSETLQSSARFDLESGVVYTHSTSTAADSHLLVACGTQHPAIRLVDLRSGSSTHSLPGHNGSVLSLAWHPRDAHILASGGTDGGVRLWDIRRSVSSLGVLDMDDSVGVVGSDGLGTGARGRGKGRAHGGAVNGVVWTEDGASLVSVGHDERMRVWDIRTGANTLVNFGFGLKNKQSVQLVPCIAPAHLSPGNGRVVYYPNPKEILSFELFDGKMLGRLRIVTPRASSSSAAASGRGEGVRNSYMNMNMNMNLEPRTTGLAWRVHEVEMYSGHADGVVRCWRPRTGEDVAVEREEKEERVDGEDGHGDGQVAGERKRKREELEQIVRELGGKKVTYS